MDVTATRLANLQDLVGGYIKIKGMTKKQAALQLDMSPSFLSQLLGGKKMGDDVARKIEAARQLPHGYMDQPHSFTVNEERTPYAASQALRIDPETIAAALKLIRLTYQNLQGQGVETVEPDNEEDGTELAYAYEYLYRNGQRLVTPENVIDFSKILAKRLRGNDDDEQRDETRTGNARSAR